MEADKSRNLIHLIKKHIAYYLLCDKFDQCCTFITRTLIFGFLFSYAKTGWLESFWTPTSGIGIFALYILIVIYPRRKYTNSIAILGFLLFCGTIFVVSCRNGFAPTFWEWMFIFSSVFLSLLIINFSPKICSQKQEGVYDSKKSLKKSTPDKPKKLTLIIGCSLLIFWFFYPRFLLWFLGSDLVKSPYDNLESLFVGAALIFSLHSIFLQKEQIENDRSIFEKEFLHSQRQKLESNLFEYSRKYESLRNACGEKNLDALYTCISKLYWDINETWDSETNTIDSHKICTEIKSFYYLANKKYTLVAPLRLYLKTVQSSQLRDDEKSQYYSLFLEILPAKEQAILLTCLFASDHSYDKTSFYFDNKNILHSLFEVSNEFSNSTDTFLNVINAVICFPSDEPIDCLYAYISKLKNEHIEKRNWWKTVDWDAIFSAYEKHLEELKKN